MDRIPRVPMRALISLLGALGVAVLLLGFRAVNILQAGEDFNDAPRVLAATPDDRPVDPDGFVAAWMRSDTETYSAAGVRRLEGGGVAIETVYVRAQDGERRIEREGQTAVLTEGTSERSCDLFQGDWTCSATTPAASVEDRANGIRQLVTGEDSPYIAIREDDECFSVSARTVDDIFGAFGSSTLICFDASTGAVRRHDTTRGRRTETLTLDVLLPTASRADFALPVSSATTTTTTLPDFTTSIAPETTVPVEPPEPTTTTPVWVDAEDSQNS